MRPIHYAWCAGRPQRSPALLTRATPAAAPGVCCGDREGAAIRATRPGPCDRRRGSQRKPFPAGGRRERAQIEARLARILAVPPGGAASGGRASGLAVPSGGAGAGERTLAVLHGGTGSERRA